MTRLAVISCLLAVLVTFPSGVTCSQQDEGKVVLQESAEGTRNLRPFTVQERWEVRWDATAAISIWLNDMKGDPLERLASTHKAGKGSTFHPTGGTYFLKIICGGDWTVTVVQLP